MSEEKAPLYLHMSISLPSGEIPQGDFYIHAFFCHGCQTCWRVNHQGEIVKMPHILSIEEVPKERILPK